MSNSSNRKNNRQDILSRQIIENKAFDVIVGLISSPTIDCSTLLSSARWLNSTNYAGIVEERYSMKLCGWALCSQELTVIPKHRYKISLSNNQVYDLTERKKFCCAFCYKSSIYFANQLSSEPLWDRDPNTPIKIKILSPTNKKKLAANDTNTENSVDNELLDKITKLGISNSPTNNSNQHANNQTTHSVKNTHHKYKIIEKNKIALNSSKQQIKTSLYSYQTSLTIPEPFDKALEMVPSLTPLEECVKTMGTWLTRATFDYLTKSYSNIEVFPDLPLFTRLVSQLKEHILIRNACHMSDSDDVSSCDDDMPEIEIDSWGMISSESKYNKIKLDQSKNVSFTAQHGKLPTIDKLRKEMVPKIAEKRENEAYLIPPVDSLSQNRLRRKIIIEQIDKAMNYISPLLKFSLSEFKEEIQNIAKTFRLHSNNISLKPIQWQFVSIILLHLISIGNPKLRESLQEEATFEQLNTIFAKYNEIPQKLSNLALIYY